MFYGFCIIWVTPILLMIFAPHIIEPVFQYFAGWNRKVLFGIVINISFLCFYYQFRSLLSVDSLIYLKLYYVVSTFISVIAFYTPFTFLIYKILFYAGYIGMFLFVILFNYLKGTMEKNELL